MITSRALRIDTDMVHGRLFIVSPPGALIDTTGLSLTYSKLKLRSKDAAADPPLHIELAGRLLHQRSLSNGRDVSPRCREGVFACRASSGSPVFAANGGCVAGHVNKFCIVIALFCTGSLCSVHAFLRCSCIVASWEFGPLADEIGVMENKSLTSKEVVPE